MTNREAIEYIERECHTCKGFYAPENECIAVPQDCFECSECGVIIRDCDRWEYDRDSDCYTSHLFECSYCPNCGRMVVIE